MATWDRYKSNESGFEIIAQKGRRFTPRFYCDDPTGGVYVTKAPVAVLKLTPVVQFINTNIAWDVSQSDSSTGTIDTFDLTFGGGGASDLTGQDWSTDPKTGNVQYTSTGTYTVTLYVTDTGGNKSQAAKQVVNIVDIAGISKVYIATSDSGIFTYVPGGTPATANTGLSGGDLNVSMGKLNPHYAHLPVGQQHYWMCNDNGVAYSTDGCATWNEIAKAALGNPTNTAGDGSPPTTTDLDEIALNFDPQDIRRVYLLRVTDSTWNASNDPRAFLYWTDDYGTTWSSFGIGI
jgi:PKD repeat protein